jgi:VCBS repeat-containing protein
LTAAEWADAQMKADVAAFLENPDDLLQWESTGLITHNFENLVLVVDGVVTDPNPPAANQAPDAVNDNPTDTVHRNDPGTVTATGNVLVNDSDPDGDAVFVFDFSSGQDAGPAGDTIEGVFGFLTMAADGTWTYTVNQTDPQTLGLTGPAQDVFSYTISDGNGLFDTAVLTITVDSPEDTGNF